MGSSEVFGSRDFSNFFDSHARVLPLGLPSCLGKGMILSIAPSAVVKRVLGVALTALAMLYVGDLLWFRVRLIHPEPADPLESCTGPRVLAIPEKGGKTSYEIDQQNPEQTVTCAHSLFPHAGFKPCWYVKPRLNQPIPM
jgi:hypothetical protein